MRQVNNAREVARKVEVYARRTAHDNGKADIAMTVFCPVRQHSVELDDCTSCQYCDGLTIDALDRNPFLTCRIKEALGPQKTVRKTPDIPLRHVASMPISEIMTRSVVCVDADLSLHGLLTLFLARNISGVPVVDDRGHPIGVVTKTDLLREAYESDGSDPTEPIPLEIKGYELDLGPGFHLEPTSTNKVRDIMMPMTFTLPESASIADAAALMAGEGVHRLVVVSPSGSVVGILSALDVLHWLAGAVR